MHLKTPNRRLLNYYEVFFSLDTGYTWEKATVSAPSIQFTLYAKQTDERYSSKRL